MFFIKRRKPARQEKAPVNVSRRRFLRYTLEAGVVFGLVGTVHTLSQKGSYVRPPGSIQSEAFTATCIRCSICVEICPTNTIRLLDISRDFKNISTPVIDTEFGGCVHWQDPCLKCADNCPTVAIDKSCVTDSYQLGTVGLQTEKCVNCMVCFEQCPVEGAVLFPNPSGGKPYRRIEEIPVNIRLVHSQYKPYINMEKCVGCGLCVHYCPEKIMYLEPKRPA